PSSVAPRAMDATPASAPFTVPITTAPPAMPKRARSIGAATLLSALALVVAVAAFVRRGPHVDPIATGAPAVATPASAPASAPAKTVDPQGEAPRASDVPLVDVATLPRATDLGSVVGLPDHRLWIDGRLAPSWKALVPCGSHFVQV